MMPVYKLLKHVKFRKEVDHLLICDCKRLLDYQLPLECFDLLVALQSGYGESCRTKFANESDVIEDLITAKLIHNAGEETLNGKEIEEIWSRLAYNGPEESLHC